jgi:glycosyltransferase involved in cell wall biosynthesis
MHVVQANLLPAPAGMAPEQVLARWPSLVDIAEIALAGGTRVTVVQASTAERRIVRNGIDFRFADVAGAGDPDASTRRLAGLLDELDADVLHVQGLAFAANAWALARHMPGLPILCQDHADRVPAWWRRGRWKRWFSAVSAVAFTAVAQARPFLDAGIFAADMQLFPIPESSSRFTPGDREAARILTGMHGNPCVLWVGHLDPNKDPLTVLDAVAEASARLPGLQLWCAFASAPLLDAVHARLRGHPGLAARVHLVGRVPHDGIQAMLRAADLFVSGSHREGSGYALLEAMACDTPPAVTDIPAFRAVTGDGTVGRLWPPGDAPALARALVDLAFAGPPRGRVRAHFDATLAFEVVGRHWAEAYARTVERHARRLQ